MRKLLIGIVALVLLLAAGYASLPWLIRTLVGPGLADEAGLDRLIVDIGYPSLDGVRISRLHLQTRPLRVDATDIDIRYSLEDLRAGRVNRINAARLTLSMMETDASPLAAQDRKPAQSTPPQPMALKSVLEHIPADRITVEHLEIAVPARDFAAHGNLSLDETGLEAELRGIRPEIARDLEAFIALRPTGLVQVSIEDPDPQAPSAVHLQATPADTQLDVQGAFSITGYGLELAQELAGIPQGNGTLSGDFATRLPWPLLDMPQWRTLTATAHLDANWSLADPAIELTDVAASLKMEAGSLTVTPEGTAGFSTEALKVAGSFGGGSFIYGDGLISSDDARLSLMAETSELKAHAGVQSIRFAPAAPLGAEITGSLVLHHEATQLQGSLSTRLTEANRGIEGTFDFSGTADASRFVNLANVSLASYPLMLGGSLGLRGDFLEANATVSAGPVVDLPFTIQHNLDSNSGTMAFTHTQSISEPLLRRLLPGWQKPYDINGGEIDLNGQLQWGEGLDGEVELQPRHLTASYDDYTLINAGGTLSLSLTDSKLALLPSTITIEAIDVGIPVTNVALTLAGSLDALTVSGATAELLGGQASTNTFDYEIDTGSADITVSLVDVDLSEILALEGEKVSGTGRLSGTLPVKLRNNATQIAGGAVTASIPGRIVLSPTLTASITQPGLDIAFKALEDFNYDTLAVNVNYDEEGNMLLGVRLEGFNPALEDGRPVHFNLNISENLPVLFRSLRLQDNFTKTLERRVTR
ncbi:MAG: hypothetical protein EP301_06615 [Gammaproteobacteria bacterium]|nr:MAG: hypothetical protein EP301_06615 [Gammaproteobacteria bacterium]